MLEEISNMLNNTNNIAIFAAALGILNTLSLIALCLSQIALAKGQIDLANLLRVREKIFK